MSEPIVYIDRSRIRPGRLDDLKLAIDELVEFIEAREPQLLCYGFYLDEGASRMTVVAVHPDPASVELHMEVGAAAFSRFGELLEMEGIEVYGEASDRMLDQLRRKAEMLGDHGRVTVQPLRAGFSRLGTQTGPITTNPSSR